MTKLWTLTGTIDLHNPQPEDVRILDIARGLSCQYRCTGQTIRPYTVAEHSVLLSLIVPELYARKALLHDAAEAYLGDLIAPVKHLPSMSGFRHLEHLFEHAIYTRFGVSPFDGKSKIKRYEEQLRLDETQLISPRALVESPCIGEAEPLGITIPGLRSDEAEILFISRFAELFPEELLED